MAALLLIAALASPATASATQVADTDVSFVGAGWGHGVGLSQFGAYGASRDGWTADQILGHFYKGMTLETMGEGDLTAPEDIWVGLVRDQETITLIARQIYYVEPPGPRAAVTVTRGEETWEMAVAERLEINRIAGTGDCDLRFITSAGAPIRTSRGSCNLDITWDGDAEEPTRKMEIDGCEFKDWNGVEGAYPPGGSSLNRPCQYGRGHMVVRAPGDGSTGPFDVSVILDIEAYLLGISEMPYWWGHEQAGGLAALEAQAIAARSYARELQLYRGDPGANSCGASCHVRDDTYDQRYIGWGHGWSTWTAAVQNTAGKVMTHPDAPGGNTEHIVRGYYSSSSGGATENGHEVSVGGSIPKEYYSSADDHWALDPTLNANASWTFTFDAGYVAARAGLDTLESVAVVERNTSTSARTIRLTGIKNGAQTTVDKSGSWARTTFGLKSVYFNVSFGDPGVFEDIAKSVHHDDIIYIADLGITKGCNPPANTAYCPTRHVTRGEMAAFLVRTLNLTDDGGKDWFADDNGSLFEADINKLGAAGITRGCNVEATEFCSDSQITRGEMAAFLVRGFGYADAGVGDWFNDDDDSIFEADIDRLKVAGVTVGCNPPENTNYCPDDPVQRDQMASFLARALRGASL